MLLPLQPWPTTDSSDDSDDEDDPDDETNQRRVIPRAKRVKYDHVKTHADIMTGILNPDAILSGSQFELFYRISKRRFQAILEDVCNDDETFYHPSLKKGPCVKARLLLPLKTQPPLLRPLLDESKISKTMLQKILCNLFAPLCQRLSERARR